MNLLYPSRWQLILLWANLRLAMQNSVVDEVKQISIVSTPQPPSFNVPQPSSVLTENGASTTVGTQSQVVAQEKHQPPRATHQSLKDSSPSHTPDDATKVSDGSRAYPSFTERWSSRMRLLKTALRKLKSSYKKYMMDLKNFLNLLERHNSIPVFSEIEHLQSRFGEVYDYYKSLGPAENKRFWEIFRSNHNLAAYRQSTLSSTNRRLAQLQRSPSFKTLQTSPRPYRAAQSPKSPNPIDESSSTKVARVLQKRLKMAQQAMETLEKIDEGQHDHDRALSESIDLVTKFLGGHSNGASISAVSRKLRAWKKKYPSGSLKLEHPYQMVFIDLFGPGELIKPTDKNSLERFQKAWDVGDEIHTILEVSSDAKQVLSDLYAAEERHSQRGFWRFWKQSDDYKESLEKAAEEQKIIHQKLLQAFKNEETLQKKMEEIASLRVTEQDLIDERSRINPHALLAFIEPLRVGRKHDDHPDIYPLLKTFGLHTTPRTMNELMKLSDSLIPWLRIQYKHQMIARDFRQLFEYNLDAPIQHRILQLLRQTVDQHELNHPERAQVERNSFKTRVEVLAKECIDKIKALKKWVVNLEFKPKR